MKIQHIPQTTRGFTLIELMVVIAVIGIFASIVLASLMSARTKARIGSAQSTMKSIQAGLVTCLNEVPPVAITLPTHTQGGGGGTVCAGSVTKYMMLPTGWLYCGNAIPAGECSGHIRSVQTTGVSFSVSAEGDGKIITCTDGGCVTN